MAHDTTQGQDDRAQVELDDELVWGAAAIGRVIGRTARQTFHLASIGAIPVQRIGGNDKRGGRLVARKSKLLAIAG